MFGLVCTVVHCGTGCDGWDGWTEGWGWWAVGCGVVLTVVAAAAVGFIHVGWNAAVCTQILVLYKYSRQAGRKRTYTAGMS